MKNLWEEHTKYIKDNPNGYWFKRKLYGWGWTPATREGWFVVIAFIAAILITVTIFDPETRSDNEVLTILLPRIGAIVVLFIIISYMKGEKPRWQWGEEEEGQE